MNKVTPYLESALSLLLTLCTFPAWRARTMQLISILTYKLATLGSEGSSTRLPPGIQQWSRVCVFEPRPILISPIPKPWLASLFVSFSIVNNSDSQSYRTDQGTNSYISLYAYGQSTGIRFVCSIVIWWCLCSNSAVIFWGLGAHRCCHRRPSMRQDGFHFASQHPQQDLGHGRRMPGILDKRWIVKTERPSTLTARFSLFRWSNHWMELYIGVPSMTRSGHDIRRTSLSVRVAKSGFHPMS